jgi:ATP-dependent protease ClpP protease subunit
MNSANGKICTEDEEDMKESEQEIKPFEYFEQNLNQKVHHFYLSGEIGEPNQYVKMVHTIQSAPAHDTIYIHLNTPGGYLHTGVQIVNAMRNAEAQVVCSLEGEAHSLGSLIFLAADQFIVHDNTTLMIHNFSGAIYGKGKEAEMQMNAALEWFYDIGDKYYIPFLTKKEFEGIVNDTDIWLHADEIRERLEKMVKAKQRELKKSMA